MAECQRWLVEAIRPVDPPPADLPPPNPEDVPPGDDEIVWRAASTFDNGATYREMRLLARANRVISIGSNYAGVTLVRAASTAAATENAQSEADDEAMLDLSDEAISVP